MAVHVVAVSLKGPGFNFLPAQSTINQIYVKYNKVPVSVREILLVNSLDPT